MGRPRLLNKYVINADECFGYLRNGGVFFFDRQDYDLIKDFTWHRSQYGYARTTMYDKGKKALFMHRLILTCFDPKIITDHINRNRLDNRKSNLRIACSTLNQINRSPRKDNVSGTTGVLYCKKQRRSPWRSYIHLHRQRINLGSYRTKLEAIKARKDAETKYQNLFA